jgi:membrane-bound lytic murein transglycosylase D
VDILLRFCRNTLFFSIVLVFLLLSPAGFAEIEGAGRSINPFPHYPEIKANVEFWKLIYSKYTSRQWVLHDADDLSLIYKIVDVPTGVSEYSRRARRYSARKARDLKRILLNLSRGHKPKNQKEERLLKLFEGRMDAKTVRRAAYNIRVQLGQANRFKQGVIRSGAWLDYIQKIFSKHNLPADLIYLPHVESSFDSRAYSKFGALGIWQFTRGTGRRYMKVGYTIDERRDPEIATIGAAKLLKYNYGQLKSWPLALTAYNHGLAGMKRAVRRAGSNDYVKIFLNHRGRKFRFASKNFYSEFLAAVDVAKNYKKYFGDLKLDKPIESISVSLPKATDAHTLAKHLNISKTELARYNPALRPVVFRTSRLIPRGFDIKLPVKKDQKWAELMTSLPATKVRRVVPSGEWVRVQPGDTLIGIAKQYRVWVKDLMVANQLEDDRILIGQILKLPVAGGVKAKKAPVSLEKPVVVAKVEKETEQKKEPFIGPPIPPKILAKKRAALIARGSFSVLRIRESGTIRTGVITVEPEETLGHFAEWLDIPTQRVRDVNGFAFRRNVHIGERIFIPLKPDQEADFEEKRLEYHSSLEEDFFATYKVTGLLDRKIRRGDNIWTLCQEEFEVPFWLVASYNPGKDFDKLVVGDVVYFPVVEPISGN